MLGASRDSLAALRESLDSRGPGPELAEVSRQLLDVADLLGRERSLRVALSDAGAPEAGRVALAEQLLGPHLSEASLSVVRDAVRARWSADADLVDAVEQLAAQAAFMAAESDGTLDRVEEELFRFGRAVDASADLQMALTDPALGADAKSGIVTTLLQDKAAPTTRLLLEYTAGHLRGRRVDAAVTTLSDLAARQREQVVAEVRSAVPLAQEQRRRLVDALSRIKGRTVRLNLVVDPAVLGGIAVKIGDEVIDGTVANRLEQARRALHEA